MIQMQKVAYTVGGIVLVVLAGFGLILLARGSSYDLQIEDPAMGPSDAPVVIEEFGDFQCPACKQAAVAVKEVLKAYPTQVKIIYKDFPIPGHAHARVTAAAALCAAQQGKFTEFYDKLFATQPDWVSLSSGEMDAELAKMATDSQLDLQQFNACRNSRTAKTEVSADAKEGIDRGVTSTPTFFIEGEKQQGVLTVFQWIQRINAVLEKKGLQPESIPQSEPAQQPAS